MTVETNLKSHVIFLSEKIGKRNYVETSLPCPLRHGRKT